MKTIRTGPSLLLAAMCAALVLPAWASVRAPRAESPGDARRAVEIEGECPTFRWEAVDGAQAYELVVLPAETSRGAAWPSSLERRLEAVRPALRVRIPATVQSWTPTLEQCLTVGADYEWSVRQSDRAGAIVGEWSEARRFRVAPTFGVAPAPDANAVASVAPPPTGNSGTGGIPAVLAELDTLESLLNERFDAIEARLETDQDALLGRFDGVDMSLANLDSDLYEHAESVKPCTPQRWRDGKCSILNVSASVCFSVGAGGQVEAEWALDPGIDMSVGGSWHEVPQVELKATVGAPLAISPLGPFGPPVILPDVAGGVAAGASGEMQICIAELTIPLDGTRAGAADGFVDRFVAAMDAQAGEISDRVMALLDERGLDGSRIVDTLQSLEDLRGGGIELDDPLNALRAGSAGAAAAASRAPASNSVASSSSPAGASVSRARTIAFRVATTRPIRAAVAFVR